ncbi:hypothetical protein PIB30_069665 [Stylosanthes scabra]|uniref:Uncharacterized protein n=1 Tax=Stylosanthes scabra TaxID=79078 RepID=A0ABU6QNA3_9FABA|nr:hypothetical protein [Stylosanthes scabra]
MSEVYKAQIHEKIIIRALKRAREQVSEKEGQQYNKLHDYVAELLRTNSGSTESPNCGQGSNSGTSQPPMDPIEKARKSKKKKPRIVPPSNIGQAEEMDYFQSAPTPKEHAAPAPAPGPSHSLPAHPLPARFRIKQPIVRPPTTPSANPKESQHFTFMPTPGFRPPRQI